MNRRTILRLWLLLPAALLLALLTACGSKQSAQTTYYDETGAAYTVDHAAQTITADGVVYRYTVSSRGEDLDFEVTYPDGSTYWWTRNGLAGYGGWSDDYDPNKYVAGDVLWDALQLDEQIEYGRSSGYVWLGLLLILLGGLHAAKPRAMWYVGYGWRFKDAEPSDVALVMERISGVVGIVIGVICLLA